MDNNHYLYNMSNNQTEKLENFVKQIQDASNRWKANENQLLLAKNAYYRSLDMSYDLLKETQQHQHDLIVYLLSPQPPQPAAQPLETVPEGREDNL